MAIDRIILAMRALLIYNLCMRNIFIPSIPRMVTAAVALTISAALAAGSSPTLMWQDYDQPGYRSAMKRYSAAAELALTNRLQTMVADDKVPPATIENYLERLVSICMFQDKFDTAEQYCTHALRFSEKQKLDSACITRLHILRAKLRFKQGKYTEAELQYNVAAGTLTKQGEEAAKTALESQIKKGLAAVYTEEKRFDEAEKIYRSGGAPNTAISAPQLTAVLEKRPALSETVIGTFDETQGARRDLVAFAKCLYGQGKLDEAAQNLLMAIELDRRLRADEEPTLAAEFNDLACVLVKQGKYEEAEKCLNAALKICHERKFTDLHEWLENKVIVLKAEGKLADAQKLQGEADRWRHDHQQTSQRGGDL